MENIQTNPSKSQEKSGNGLGKNQSNQPVERVTAGAHEAVDKIANASHHAADVLGEKGAQLQNLQEEWLADVRKYVNGHPVQSLGIAVAGGFLLSRLLRNR